MDFDRWQKMERLFGEAIALSPEQRGVFLDEQSTRDPALIEEIKKLLTAEERAGLFLDRTVEAGLRDWASGANEVGRLLGVYRLDREIGRGGMSSVFLARREDDEYQQRVAVKLIRRGMDTPEVRARFRMERQILANLDHAHIAKVLDGGTTPEGLPYIVMEYIDGLPLDQYCNQRELSHRQRIRLFLKICGAVQSAHRQLVIHRDLKPGNVLVTAEGEPKLLDFGIAKLLDSEFASEESVTLWGPYPLTLAYASPEQVRGQTVTTATDIYSLGVLLFHLLTGNHPFPGEDGQALATRIREQEPVKPSETVVCETPEKVAGALKDGQTHEQRARHLRGDLDCIILKALRKEPEQRYGSVAEMAQDLDHFLQDRPVKARHGTTVYRVSKFLRRHLVGTVAFLTIIASIAFALAVMWWQTQRANEERERAERISNLLVALFETADPLAQKGATITGKELLDRGTEKVLQELSGQTETRAMFLETLGGLYERLGLYVEARDRYQQALRAFETHHRGDHITIGRVFNHLGRVLAKQGSYPAAQEAFLASYEMRVRLLGPNHSEISGSLNNLALVYQDQGLFQQAKPAYERALELDRRWFGDDHVWTAITKSNYALLHYDMGVYDEAETLTREVLEFQRQKLSPQDDSLAASQHQLGLILHARGQFEEAEWAMREALAIQSLITGADHPTQARYKNHLAALLRDSGHFQEAHDLFQEALVTQRQALGPFHTEVALTLQEYAWLLLDTNRLEEAEAAMERSVEILRETLPEGTPLLGVSLSGLGVILERQRAYDCAKIPLEEGLAVIPPGHPKAAIARESLAWCR